MKRFSILAACAVFAAVGCGGGGTTDTGGDGGKTLEFGPIITNVTGAIPPPLITSGSGVVITGVYGGRVNDLRLKRPAMNTLTAEEVADQTLIAFNQLGHPSVFEYSTGNVYSIGLEDGAGVSSESYIDISPDGTKIVAAEYVGDNFQLVLRNIDGTGRVQLTSGGSFHYLTPHFSTNGSKILYSRADALLQSARIYSMNLDGTNKTQVSSGFVDFSATSSPDGSKISFYRRNADGSESGIWMMNADGTNRKQLTEVNPDLTVGPLCEWAPVGDSIAFTSQITGDDYRLRIIHADYDQVIAPPTTIQTSTNLIEAPTWSPDGAQIAYEQRLAGNPCEIRVVPAYGGNSTVLLGRPYPVSPSWGPYVQERKFIGGAPNVFGTVAGGFLFGQQGSLVTSLVSFDATTRNGITLHKQDDQNPNQPNVIVTVESSDTLTSLQFVNSMMATPTKVITGVVSTQAEGAIISFDANTGRVVSVIPYGDLQGAAMKTNGGTQKTFTGKLLGIWNEKGENIAPGGATEVVIDSTTGKLISHK